MNASEKLSLLSNGLYDQRYTGEAKKSMDSQEQYEALLTRWGFHADQRGLFAKKASAMTKTAIKVLKSAFNMMTASAMLAKQHSVNRHIVATPQH